MREQLVTVRDRNGAMFFVRYTKRKKATSGTLLFPLVSADTGIKFCPAGRRAEIQNSVIIPSGVILKEIS